ncbi:PTS fructose transporter subunit IIC [Pediococcus ethanolidurans]|uniref:Fructose-like permease IIC component n=1 Tax=Pediococcus ethanolidurans TaxID=319653 RepID=A0A0R2KA53_9LACO|nr:PTS fructose transporter subunit IIC [Pediococcus ethanolidurans]KRN83546.1 fructose-like permease IIC component [Pediococcus ethanolidurans]MBU7564362.1 PTS fructose transporter subunit IIC [Pediococcus ethanolidurans]MCV3322389.1 PTS fructose transporter subunit IIC [Pediococcus ethanolidurans]MCV3324451.1 PTS fructose transporter subunit IIC [Pediococcus ethanolidurans]MCV3555861.1 PTS fructose transporter subunit IIC [Pediococcus ethanolidurans]
MNWKKFGKELANHFQTGVSYMIPLVTAAGLLTSIAVIFGGTNVWNQTSNIWGNLRLLGQTGLGFIPVIIAAYISYSIADRPGLAPAFIVGLVASSMGTGFLGGMLVGLLVGYLVQWLKKIPMPANLTAVKSLIVIPFLATLVVGLFLIYVVGDPIKAMTVALTAWLKGMSGANAVLLAALLGGMMAVDMGGPINKIAYAFGMAAFTSGGYQASTAMLMAIGIPPLGMFVATLLGGKKLYSDAEIESGRSALVMGIVGITEGTIPFAVADPVRVIPSIIVGTAAGCATNALFGTYQKTALSTVMAIPFSSNVILYTVAILVGVIITALLVNFLKRFTRHNSEAKEG